MTTAEMGLVDRRWAIGGAIAVAAGVAWPHPQIRQRAIVQRGIAGGGVVETEGGEAHFSLFASSVVFSEGEGEDSEPIFAGSVHWVDAAQGLTLESTLITLYENLNSEQGEGRRIRGMMRGGGDGEQPFMLDVLALGAPGSGQDEITLVVGVSAGVEGAATPEQGVGFSYTANGVIVSGDVQDVDFAIDVDTGEVGEAPPVA